MGSFENLSFYLFIYLYEDLNLLLFFCMVSRSKQLSLLDVHNPLHKFVIGTILGDGYITKRGSLQVDQKVFDYAEWKFLYLKNLQGNVLPESTKISTVRRSHKKTGNQSTSHRFNTKTMFEEWRKLFYIESFIAGQNAVKKIPDNLADLLVYPISLAIWFMDDGGKGGNTKHGRIISVAGFSDKDTEILQSTLMCNFNISMTFHAKESSRQLFIPVGEYKKWDHLIYPFIIPSQRYKFLITP